MATKAKPNLWYVVILGVAGAGLGFDTFVLRAKATPGSLAVDSGTTSAPITGTSLTPTKPNEPLGDRFEAASALLEAPAFRRLDGFIKPSPESVGVTSDDASKTGGFLTRHKLTAVLSQPSGDLAVVDGALLRVGDTVEGLRLSVIEKDGVVFEAEGKQIRLPLARPNLDR